MFGTYLAPGVYVEPLSNTGPRPIESLAAAVLAMIGLYDPNASKTAEAGKPKLVTSWSEFANAYGELDKGPGYLHQTMYGYFLNGGRWAYIVGIPASPTPTAKSFEDGIATLEAQEDVTLLACPDVFATHVAAAPSAAGATKPASGTGGSKPIMADSDVTTVQKKMIDHCAKMGDRIVILDIKPDLDVNDATAWRKNTNIDSQYATAYYPWIGVPKGGVLVAGNSDLPMFVPPSGHIAGVFARVDSERGVHKAPANEIIRGVSSLQYNVTRADQAILNPTPVSLNCIRAFPGQGIRIWGARTLSSDTQWRYVNVQRLVSNIEDSITDSIRWAVFEPNDQILWAAIKRDISAYLTQLWRQGALLGKTPAEAFYVKCDAETNPSEVIDAGQCVVEIGVAPVKPAEFVVVRISQWEGGTTTTVVGGLIAAGA